MGIKLGQTLFQYRKNKNLTQDEVVRKSEQYCQLGTYPDSAAVTRSALANYEKGIRTPNNLKLRLLADIYEADYAKLVGIAAVDIALENNGDRTLKELEVFKELSEYERAIKEYIIQYTAELSEIEKKFEVSSDLSSKDKIELSKQEKKTKEKLGEYESRLAEIQKDKYDLEFGFGRKKTSSVTESEEIIDFPTRLAKIANTGNVKPDELVLMYCSREELVLLEKIKRLNSENRKRIEDRIDLMLDIQ